MIGYNHHSRPCDTAAEPRTPLWFLISSLLLVGVAIVLLALVLGNRLYTSDLSVAALIVVLFLLGFTAFLYVRAWYLERRHVYANECQFESVYLHALDGILILDDQAVCLDANPAAFALLGAPPAMLMGHSFAKFFGEEFERQWKAFLACRYQRGQTELFRPDGLGITVHYTIANYLAGRNVLILCNVTERVQAQDALRQSRERYQLICDNIDEVVWLMDASTKEVLELNRAYESISGRSLESILRDPSSYIDLIHPEHRAPVLAKLESAVHTGHFDEEFRIVRPDGSIRWVRAKTSPLSDESGVVRQLAGTTQDITARKVAEAQVAEHLVAVEKARDQADAARAEAEALRKATLALTQNLRMDAVLDTLLETLRQIIPYEMASVILTEEEGRLFVARESPASFSRRPVVTLELGDNPLLQQVIRLKKSIHLEDTHAGNNWREVKPFLGICCWIAVPLLISDTVLGLLSIGSHKRGAFGTEDLRKAKSLALPAAVAIHNARLYEWAQIYAAERQGLLKQADSSQEAGDHRPRSPWLS